MARFVTIVVLLILAGITITYVMGDNSIFKQAQNAKVQTEMAKAKERLEIVFNSLHLEKYAQNLTLDALDKRITEEVNKMRGEEIGDDKKEIIIDGYRFQVDRTVPKIEEELGPADGVIITASVSGNNGWFKQGETINITITGIIKTYSGGNITEVSATKGGEAITDFSIDGDGKYTINNITENTIIVINAEDSNKKSNSRTIPITIKIDNISPTVDTITASSERMKIIFKATGTDKESGIKQFNYSITPKDGIPEDKVTGTFTVAETVEIMTTPTGVDEKTYTITVTATDNAGNTTLKENEKTAQVTTENYLTISEAKNIVKDTNWPKYIGIRISDYTCTAGGTWRLFYFDDEGYFGKENTLFLRRDKASESIKPGLHTNHISSDENAILMELNPLWTQSLSGRALSTTNEKAISWLADPEVWSSYKSEEARYAIACASSEMVCKAYNIYTSGSSSLPVSAMIETKKKYNDCNYYGYLYSKKSGSTYSNTWWVYSSTTIPFFNADYNSWLCSVGAMYNDRVATWDGVGIGNTDVKIYGDGSTYSSVFYPICAIDC